MSERAKILIAEDRLTAREGVRLLRASPTTDTKVSSAERLRPRIVLARLWTKTEKRYVSLSKPLLFYRDTC